MPRSATAAGPPAIRVLIDDTPVSIRATVINDVLYFPLRALVSAMRGTLRVARPDLEIRRADGRTFAVRPGRREVWSGSMVTAVAEAVVLVVKGVTIVPAGTVEAIFEALVVWDKETHTAVIVTRSTFQSADPGGPPPRRAPARRAAPARAFVPEFLPWRERPVAAAGVVGFVLSAGAVSGFSVGSRLGFTSRGGDAALAGAFALGAGTQGPAAAEGVLTWRRGSMLLSAGVLSISDSPLTLYEQGFIGLLYEQRFGGTVGRFFGGVLSGSNTTVYGTTFRFSPVGVLLPQATVLYSPDRSAAIVRARADWRLGSGWSLFGEVAYGSSLVSSGTGWRAGMQFSSARWSASLSYLALSSGFPALGNAAVFAGRHGPAVEFGYFPNKRLLVLGSAALLSGRSETQRRFAYRVFMQYWLSPSLAVVGEAHSTDRPEGGIRVRRDTVQAALLLTSGRWSTALILRHGLDEQASLRANMTSLSLQAAYLMRNGRPVWAEIGQIIGDRRGWTLGGGARVPLSSRLDLTAHLRVESMTYPNTSLTRTFDLGVVRPLTSGAELSIGASVTVTSSAGMSGPSRLQLTVGYRRPFAIFGPLKVGRVAAEVFVDANANGRRDREESPVAGIVIRIDGKSAAQTDAAGRAIVDGVREGLHQISMDENTIPVGLVAMSTETSTQVRTDGTVTVAFPLVPAATLRCVVYLDENGSGARDAGEPGIPDVGVMLLLVDRRMTTELDGTVVFTDLTPGTYTVALDPHILPDTVKVGETTTYTANLTAGTTVTCALPVLPARGVIRTFP